MEDFYLEPEVELNFEDDVVAPEDAYLYTDTLVIDHDDD